jgi:hypothetical protein
MKYKIKIHETKMKYELLLNEKRMISKCREDVIKCKMKR